MIHGAHNPPAPFRKTIALIRSERGGFAVALVYSVAIGLLSLVLPVAVQALVNTVAFGSVLQPVAVLTFIVTIALAVTAVLYTLRSIVLEMVQRRIFVRQASAVLESLLRFRIDALDPHHAPELVNRFLDVTTVQKSASVLAVDGLTVAMQTFVGVCLLAAYHPYLLIFDVVLVLSIGFVLLAMGRGAVRTSIEESKSKYEVLAWMEEVARHSVALRSTSGAEFAVRRTNELTEGYLENRGRHFRVLIRQIASAQALQAIALASLLGIGAHLVIAGELTLGQLVAAELVVSLAVGSFAKFGKSLETYYDLQAALDKLSYLTDLPLERVEGETARAQAGPAAVQVSGLTFQYSGHEPVLRELEFAARGGSRVAILGRSASGKSTLLDLVGALRESASGSVRLDGVDYRHLKLEALRDQVMLVRGKEILAGSVASNVALGRPASTDEIREALRKAGLGHAMKWLPRGLDTELGPSGRPLSPSQAQRLAFARAILHQPRVLLIDEALDTIDDLSLDGELVRTLFDPAAPWTLIAASGRREILALFQHIYELRDGRLREMELELAEVRA